MNACLKQETGKVSGGAAIIWHEHRRNNDALPDGYKQPAIGQEGIKVALGIILPAKYISCIAWPASTG
jgi:hypothetical protein